MTKDKDIVFRNTEESNNGNYDKKDNSYVSSGDNMTEIIHIQSLYPGQPEKEECVDESIPPTTDCASDRMLQSHKTAEDHTVDKSQEVELRQAHEEEDSLISRADQFKEHSQTVFSGDKLTRDMVVQFIDTVYVYDKNHIEVRFLFHDLVEELAGKLE